MSATSTVERIPLTLDWTALDRTALDRTALDRPSQGRTVPATTARDRSAQGRTAPRSSRARAARRTDRRAASSRRPVSRAAARPAPRPTATSPVARQTSAAAQASPAPAAPRVHLTRRGRLLALVLLVGVLLGAFSLGRSASQASTVGAVSAPAALSLEQVTVQSGESLWTVARRISTDHDPRDVVAQIRRLNGLTDPRLRPGQQLLVPVAA